MKDTDEIKAGVEDVIAMPIRVTTTATNLFKELIIKTRWEQRESLLRLRLICVDGNKDISANNN